MKKATIHKLEVDLARLNARAESAADFFEFLASSASILESVRFLLVLIRCFIYLANYVRNVKFDNAYITQEFMEIDALRRLNARKRTLMPLKRFEIKEIFSPFQFYISKHQNPSMKISLAINIGLLVVLVFSIALDYLVYDFLGNLKD